MFSTIPKKKNKKKGKGRKRSKSPKPKTIKANKNSLKALTKKEIIGELNIKGNLLGIKSHK